MLGRMWHQSNTYTVVHCSHAFCVYKFASIHVEYSEMTGDNQVGIGSVEYKVYKLVTPYKTYPKVICINSWINKYQTLSGDDINVDGSCETTYLNYKVMR